MIMEGGCYCGNVRYRIDGGPLFKAQCHCRECQYISGGHPSPVMGIPEPGFTYTLGTPTKFRRPDLEHPVTREFCGTCGTHLVTRAPSVPGTVMVKVGTLDDQSVYGGPQMAIFTIDRQSYHHLPPGIPAFERTPG